MDPLTRKMHSAQGTALDAPGPPPLLVYAVTTQHELGEENRDHRALETQRFKRTRVGRARESGQCGKHRYCVGHSEHTATERALHFGITCADISFCSPSKSGPSKPYVARHIRRDYHRIIRIFEG